MTEQEDFLILAKFLQGEGSGIDRRAERRKAIENNESKEDK